MKARNVAAIFTISILVMITAPAFASEEKEEVKEAPTVEKAVEDPDAIAPWILEARKGLEKYRDIKLNFKGRQGQIPVWDTDLFLTNAEVEKLKKGNYKIAYCWQLYQGEYTEAIKAGVELVAEKCNMRIVGETDANLDSMQQRADVETTVQLNPDIIITAAVDNVSAPEVFKPAVDAGIKLVFISTQPDGYRLGKEVHGLATANPQAVGVMKIRLLAELAGKDAKIGFLFYDQDFWYANVFDDAARMAIKNEYPDMQVLEELGFGTIEGAGVAASSIITRHPEVEAIYTPWNGPGLEAVSACEAADRPDIQVISYAVDAPTLIALIKGPNLTGLVADMPYQFGMCCALLGAYALIDKPAPEFVATPVVNVTKDNIRDIWDLAMKVPLPQSVDEELKKKGF
jgi:ribose transport system substrate-binding protein